MWTVVYIARCKENADALKSALEHAGILAKLRHSVKKREGEDVCYEVMVPAAEVEEAHNIIIDVGF